MRRIATISGSIDRESNLNSNLKKKITKTSICGMDDREEEEYHYESEEFNDEEDEYEEEEEEEEPVDEGEKDDIDEETPAPEGTMAADAEAEDDELEEEVAAQRENPIINKINERDSHHRIIKVVAPDDRVTSNIIQRPEMVEAIGHRLSQIEQGSPVFTDVTGLKNPIEMAKKEFVDRQSPLILVRPMRKEDDYWIVEKWKVREMTFPIETREIMKITEKQVMEAMKGTTEFEGEQKKPSKKAAESPKKAAPAKKAAKAKK